MTIDETKLHNLEDAARNYIKDNGALQKALNDIPKDQFNEYYNQYKTDKSKEGSGLPPADMKDDCIVFGDPLNHKVYDYSNYIVGPKDWKENPIKEAQLIGKDADLSALDVAKGVNKIVDASQHPNK